MPQPTAPSDPPSWAGRIQVLLLGLTSVVLSLASGWTTWLGMTNFTQEAVLSLMITFGIQGVMMVLSWVLGSQIANARAIRIAAQAARAPRPANSALRWIEWLLISSIILVALNLIAHYFGFFEMLRASRPELPSTVMMFAGISLALLAILVLVPHGPELIRSTVQAFVSGTKHFVVIAMLAACLFASVFFSFDSLFSRILPDEERRRIADFRSRSVVMDIRSTLQAIAVNERNAQQKAFFDSVPWSNYKAQLDEIASALKAVPASIDVQLARLREATRQTQSAQENRTMQIAIERRQVEQDRIALENELKTASAQAARQREAMANLTERIAQLQRSIAVKAAEVDAEENGLGSSRRKGRGPNYRKLATEAAVLQSALLRSNAELEVLKSQRDTVSKTIADLKAEIAGRISAEQKLISKSKDPSGKTTEQGRAAQLTARKAQVQSHLGELRAARRRFEAAPSASTLETLGARCTGSVDLLKAEADLSALKSTPTCNINELRVGAAALSVLVDGLDKLATDCQVQQAQDSLGFEAEVNLARDCIVKSGLLPTLTAPITAKLDRLERERDDKAHRFVVSMNAFIDGDKLAFLAAGIALAIDLLVLVSGLLGALALRPRAFDIAIPSEESRKHLDGDRQAGLARILRLALGNGIPEENAKRVLQYIEPAEVGSGICMTVEVAKVTAEDRAIVQQFLNVGTAFAQVYSTSAPNAAVAIDRDLYFAAVELADLAKKPRGHQSNTRSQPAAPSSLRDRLTAPKTVFTHAGRTDEPGYSEAEQASTARQDQPVQAPAAVKTALRSQSPDESETAGQPAVAPSSADAPSPPQAQPNTTPPNDVEAEDQLVSVADGNFKFDLSRK